MSDIIQEIEPFDLIRKIGRRTKQYQAVVLQELEKIYDKDSQEFKAARKVLLDESSNLSRNIVRDVFGDIEYMIR